MASFTFDARPENDDRETALVVAKQARKAPAPTIRYPARPEGVTKLKDVPPATPEEVTERIAPFRKIVAEHQFQRIRWYDHTGKQRSMVCDVTSASVVCQVIDKISPEYAAMLAAMEPPGIVALCYKAIK